MVKEGGDRYTHGYTHTHSLGRGVSQTYRVRLEAQDEAQRCIKDELEVTD